MKKLLFLKIIFVSLFLGSSGHAASWFFENERRAPWFFDKAINKFLGTNENDSIKNSSDTDEEDEDESVVDVKPKSKKVTHPVEKETTKPLLPTPKKTSKKTIKKNTVALKQALRSTKTAPITAHEPATKKAKTGKTATPPKKSLRSAPTTPVTPVKNIPKAASAEKKALRYSKDATPIAPKTVPQKTKKSSQKIKADTATIIEKPAKRTLRSGSAQTSPESENLSASKVIKKAAAKKAPPAVTSKKSLSKEPIPKAARPPEPEDPNAIEQHRLLVQPNGWECGYYSIFHYLATKHDYEGAELKELYTAFITTITQNPLVAAAYDDEEYTNGQQLSNIITALAATDFAADLNEVLVVDEREFHETVPTTQNVVNKINALRARGETFWALVCTRRPAHWVCLMFPSEGGCFGIDSLHRSRPANNQPILVGIKNLCLGLVPLPDGEQYQTTYENYRVVSHQPESAAKNEIIAAIQAEALANGFTDETFASLTDYIDKLPMDHFPGEQPADKKKSGQRARKTKTK